MRSTVQQEEARRRGAIGGGLVSDHDAAVTVEPPAWCAGDPTDRWALGGDGCEWRTIVRRGGVLVSGRVRASADDGLCDCATALYLGIRRRIERRGGVHPVRFWNFIPSILRRADEECNRYMRFNEGRHRALEPWMLRSGCVVAATGVGNALDEMLVVHCLAIDTPGRPIENAHQVPAYGYSNRYGPLPPVFARATWIPRRRRLLVSGTASVLGEDSVGASLAEQLQVTVQNLREVSRDPMRPSAAPWRFDALRAYVRDAEDAVTVRDRLRLEFPEAAEVELVWTALCRPDLLVEVEGLAGPR